MAENQDGILALLTDAYNGTNSTMAEKRGRGRPKSDSWRLEFVPDNGIIRARLRRGSGKNRANVKDENGIITKRNFMPLGTLEEVYGDTIYKQWHKRCEHYQSGRNSSQSGGARNSHAPKSPEKGMAGITLDKWSRLEVHQPARTD